MREARLKISTPQIYQNLESMNKRNVIQFVKFGYVWSLCPDFIYFLPFTVYNTQQINPFWLKPKNLCCLIHIVGFLHSFQCECDTITSVFKKKLITLTTWLTITAVWRWFVKEMKLYKTRRFVTAHETMWIICSILNQPVSIQQASIMNMQNSTYVPQASDIGKFTYCIATANSIIY